MIVHDSNLLPHAHTKTRTDDNGGQTRHDHYTATGTERLTTWMRRPAGTLRKDNTYGSQRIFRKNTDAQTQILRKIHTQIWRKNTNK